MRHHAFLLRCALVLALPAAMITGIAAPASAATTWTVSGPSSGSPTAAHVTLTDNGTLTFSVSSRGSTSPSPSPSPSPIGIETGAADLTKDLTFTTRANQTVTEAYSMTTGKQRNRSTTYNR